MLVVFAVLAVRLQNSFALPSYVDVNINIKLCFVPQRSSDKDLVMTRMEAWLLS